MRTLIYSANFGRYDSVKKHATMPWAKLLYFTHPKSSNLKRSSAEIKINSQDLPDHDISVWVDASVRIHSDIKPLVDWFARSKHLIAIPSHPHRTCTFKEALACSNQGKDDFSTIQNHMNRYQGVLPKDFGMVATGFVMRKNTPEVVEFNDIWWREYCNGSQRDQLSVMYASWKSGIEIHQLPQNVYKNEYWKIYRHNKVTFTKRSR